MRIIIAIGGNALLQRGQKPDVIVQRNNIKQACIAIAALALHHQVIITHGKLSANRIASVTSSGLQ